MITDPSKAMAGMVQDPFYKAQLAQAEESAMRQGLGSGMGRGGATTAALTRIAPQLMNQRYNQQLQGFGMLAGQPTGAGAISQGYTGLGNMVGQGYSNIGNIQAQGILGPAQARQAGLGNLLGLGMGAAGLAFSDPKLKENVNRVSTYKGLGWYTWTWNKLAQSLGLSGVGAGVMADEVKEKRPELVNEDGEYMMVDYGALANG
jgi:hypothetical protein